MKTISKKQLLTATTVAWALLLGGCAASQQEQQAAMTSEKKQEMVKSVNNLPSWVVNPAMQGGIAAVGMAGFSKHGLQVMLPQAQMDARARLAGQIQTIVSQVQKKAMRHVKIDNLDEFENSFKQATKELIRKIPISGAQQINIFQAANGDLYVRMFIQKRDVSQHLGEMKSSVKKHMDEAKVSRQNIDEGMKVLDEMIKELDVEIQ